MNEHESTRESDEADVVVSAEAPTGAEAEASGEQDQAGTADAAAAEASEAFGRQLEQLQAQLAERDEALLRLKAEMDNTRKRAERDVESAHRYGVERLVNELLPVKDSMELGIAACSSEAADLASVREGVELTHRMLAAAMEKFGVKEVDPAGEAFNPEFHQAMSMQEVQGVEPGRVVTVVQKGYVLNERLVRPAMVIVSR